MIPDFKSVLFPFLQILGNRKEYSTQELIENLADIFQISIEEDQKRLPSGQKIFKCLVRRARTEFNRAGLIEQTRYGHWQITESGIDYLLKNHNQEKVLINELNVKVPTRIIEKLNVRIVKGKTIVSDLQYIQALGNLLTYYHSDLMYIREFHRHKNGKIGTKEYLEKSNGTFKAFINEFRVARNIDKTKTNILLKQTIDWTCSVYHDDVDGFAESLNSNGITHNKVMTSLASKILFLNNPWVILPMDSLAKKSLGLQNNIYSNYFPLTQEFRDNNEDDISRFLNSIDEHLTTIEAPFYNEIENLKTIRFNRFVDKILWTIGRNL